MEVRNIEFSYGKQKVLDDISFKIEKNKITTIIGANGCGKSTLFNIMTKNLKPTKGNVFLDGVEISKINIKTFAKKVSIVHQYNSAPNDISVENLVSYGRTAYKKFVKSDKKEDFKYIERALKITGIENFRNKSISQLSGGQRQRVWIAMALAQNTDILFLDEPTTYLDIKYQIEILQLIKELNQKYKITVIMVLHDINQAIYYSHNIIAIKGGKVIGMGSANEVITENLIKDVYGIELKIKEFENRKFIITV